MLYIDCGRDHCRSLRGSAPSADPCSRVQSRSLSGPSADPREGPEQIPEMILPELIPEMCQLPVHVSARTQCISPRGSSAVI